MGKNYHAFPGYRIIDEDIEEVEDDFDIDEEKGLCPIEEFRDIVNRFRHQLVTVEFECAGCCKKATGILRCIGRDFILLTRPDGKFVLVKIFCQGLKEPVIECARKAVIRLEKIISLELATDRDPLKEL